jgi:anti-anti-sigma factor
MTPQEPRQEPPLVEFEITPATSTAIVTLRGEHDINTKALVAEALAQAARHRRVLVDLSECAFADSSLVTALTLAGEEMRRRGARVDAVIPPDTQVRRLAEVTGLAEMVRIHDSPETAINSASAP